MKHTGTVILETSRLRLRRFSAADSEAMYHNWASDDEVTKYLTWPKHESTAVSRQVIGDWEAGYEKPDCYQWAITLKDGTQELIGSIGVVLQDKDTAMAEIGYCISRKWWQQGVTSEALAAVLRHLIRTVGFNRIQARHDVRNPNSGLVMKKCGMSYEGTMRQAGINNQGIYDICWYAVLSADGWY